MKDNLEPRYFVEAAAKALEVLESFDGYEDPLTISEVARRVGIPYASAFRFLYTLEKRGYVERHQETKKYTRTPPRRHFRMGYAAAINKARFSADVTHSIVMAARDADVDLIIKDNEMSSQKALANTDILLEEKINLLIEFQLNETVAHLIAAKCHDANVPVIAINFAQSGAYYFGGNNFLAGRMAGEFMSQYIMTEWQQKIGKLVLIPGKGMGSTQEVRKTGMLAGLERVLKTMSKADVVMTDPCLTVHEGYRETKKALQEIGKVRQNVGLMTLSDGPAIGACWAAKQMGLADRVAIVGQGAASDIQKYLRQGGPIKASVAYFPESYGDRVITMALKLLSSERVPLTVYTGHVVLTRENIEQYYPTRVYTNVRVTKPPSSRPLNS